MNISFCIGALLFRLIEGDFPKVNESIKVPRDYSVSCKRECFILSSVLTLINGTVECDTAAETVRVVKYEDTFPSLYVPQSYLENYNLF